MQLEKEGNHATLGVRLIAVVATGSTVFRVVVVFISDIVRSAD